MLDWNLVLDGALVLALVISAGAALLSRDLFRAVVFFIAFGLLMAVVWVRLNAPDLALAEAAISAGLTGALLLDAVGQLRDPNRPHERVLPWVEGLLCSCLLAALVAAILIHPEPSPALLEGLKAAMEGESIGVTHEVTAVLLDFRSYDTFLEVSVLAAAAVIGLGLQPLRSSAPPLQQVSNGLLDGLIVWLGPLMLMVAVYLLWAGTKQPGGAFQAGAVLAAAGVLLRLSGLTLAFLYPSFLLRLGLIAGYGVFLLAALSGLVIGLPLFSYPEGSAGLIIVTVEAFLTLSIGITLLSLFTAAPPTHPGHRHDQ